MSDDELGKEDEIERKVDSIDARVLGMMDDLNGISRSIVMNGLALVFLWVMALVVFFVSK